MKLRVVILSVVAPLALVACDNSYEPQFQCTGDLRFAVAVALVDSITGDAGPFRGVVAIASDGAYHDSTQHALLEGDGATPLYVSLAPDRPGLYDVTVEADGFALWRQDDVRVDENECGKPITQSLLAMLQQAE